MQTRQQQPLTNLLIVTVTKKRKVYEGPTQEEKLCNELIKMMEEGKNPWRKEWTSLNDGRHQNIFTGAYYHNGNVALMEMYAMARGYNESLWAGANQAKKAGFKIKKGSKCIYIIRPQLNSHEVKDDQGKVKKNPDGSPVIAAWTSYKPCPVFHVSCFEGEGLQELISEKLGTQNLRTEEPKRIKQCEQAARTYHKQEKLETKWINSRACYKPVQDEINMPERKLFDNSEALYSTWFHEMVHSTGHSSRLNRLKAASFGSNEYAKEELVAELGAFLICQRLQISSNTTNHAAYLSNWIGCLRQDPKYLLKALGKATSAVNRILGSEVK